MCSVFVCNILVMCGSDELCLFVYLPVSQWKSGPLVQLGWTVSDELLCVQEDGSVLIYDLFGSFKRHFSMGQVSFLCRLTTKNLTNLISQKNKKTSNSSHKLKQKSSDLKDKAKDTNPSSENSHGYDKMRIQARCPSLLEIAEDGVTR